MDKHTKMTDERSVNWAELIHHKRLDLSKKDLTSLNGIAKCKEVTWLKLSNNSIESLQCLKRLKNLVVLNASNNKISTIHHILHLQDLKALILNNNCLVSVQGIERLSCLNALVLSQNKLESIDVSSLTNISKLSLSHNLFKEVPDLQNLSNLKELRMNDNQIVDIPASICHCQSLKLADFGNNRISSFGFLEKLSKTGIENLNLKGNPISSSPDYKERVVSAFSSLKILDGRRLEQKAAGEALNVKDNTSIVGENAPDESKRLETKKQKTEREQECVKSKKVGGFVSRFKDTKAVENSVAFEVDKKLNPATKKRRKVDKEKSKLNKDLEVGEVKIDDGRGGNKTKKKFGENEKSGRGDTEKDGATEAGKCSESGESKDGIMGDVDASFKRVKQGKRKLDNNENRQKRKRGKKKRVRMEIGTETKEKVKEFEKIEDPLGSVKQTLSSEEVKKPSEKVAKGGLNAKDKETKKKKLKIEENSKRKEKGVKKAKTHVDKRSGVVSLEIVRPVSKKKRTNDVIEIKGNYDFGGGESEGW